MTFPMFPLPTHATIFDGPDVWMDPEAVAQLAAVASLGGCVRAAGMPDLHPGRGFPIGAVVATRDIVYPHLIGGDAGCGARVTVTALDRASPDKLERRLRSSWADALFDDANASCLFETAWYGGARGLADVDGLPDSLREAAGREPAYDIAAPSGDPGALGVGFASNLGTIGGGNHFAEISRVGEVIDTDAAARLGLSRGAIVAVSHSGSRGLGAALAEAWSSKPVLGGALSVYLGQLAGACRFANANRFLLSYRLLRALGACRPGDTTGGFDVTHNDVREESIQGRAAWVHRKGTAPAYEDALTVVLGSRDTPSWIMVGTGTEDGVRSVAHGAGRRLGRSDARARIRARYRRTELGRSAGGGRVLCDDPDLLSEEHPDAYKPVDPVVRALEQHELARRVASLIPIVTVKL